MSNKITYGLTSEKAIENRQKYGSNALSVKESATLWEMFVDSFKDPWVIVLCVALGIQVVMNVYKHFSGIGHVDLFEPISLMVAILLTTGVSTYTSYNNEKKFNSLQAEASKILAQVYRDGKLTELMVDDIVKDDAILLQAGDKIPADGIILKGSIKVDQAVLNGESEEAKKKELGNNEVPDSSDTFNEFKIFRGTTVMSGEAVMIATELGDNTLLGKINTSLQEDGKKSPSEEKLERLAKSIGVMGYSAATLYSVMILTQEFLINKSVPTDEIFTTLVSIFMFAVTIVIMAVPEGLPMMNTLVSAMNTGRLLKENILVRHSKTIETAGYMNVLNSDKTGTITEGILAVVDFILGDGTLYQTDKVEKDNHYSKINPSIKSKIIEGIGLNNDSNVIEDSNGKHAAGSNNTDRALLNFLISTDELSFNPDSVVEKEEFNSANKFASVTLSDGTKYIKGAPEFILDKVKFYLDEEGNQKEFTPEIRSKFDQASVEQANRSMRVLAILREVDGVQTLVTGVCIRDNVRKDIDKTVDNLNKAGVLVRMVTGDRKETAIAIAKEANIIRSEDDLVLTHDEMDALSDEELAKVMPRLKVVARALPEDKKRLVKLDQEKNLVVGMTGDGVNDSPALKAADVGFSMGDGTSVAKEASDIVILNNSLSSIEKAVLYGRTMSKSVAKFIIFQLTVNVTTIAMSLLSPLFGVKEPFTIIQILWVNLIMDTLAALAFGNEPALSRYMNEKPVPKEANILTRYMKSAIGTSALFITLGCLAIMTNFMGIHSFIGNSAEVSTFMFAFFIYSIIFNSLNTRSEKFTIFEHIGENQNFIKVMSFIAIGQTLIIQFGGKVFSTVPMDLKHYGVALLMASMIIPFDMIRKAITSKK